MRAKLLIDSLTLSDVSDVDFDTLRLIREIASKHFAEVGELYKDCVQLIVAGPARAELLRKDFERLNYNVKRTDAIVTVMLPPTANNRSTTPSSGTSAGFAS